MIGKLNIDAVSHPHQIFMKAAAKNLFNGLQFHHLLLPFSVVQAKLAGGQRPKEKKHLAR